MYNLMVLVCGGRDFNNDFLLYKELDKIIIDYSIPNLPISMDNYFDNLNLVVVHGGAKGADSLAGEWAKDRGARVEVFPADWENQGKKAGYIRNVAMADYLENNKQNYDVLVVAFPGRRGTDMMVNLALERGILVEDRRSTSEYRPRLSL